MSAPRQHPADITANRLAQQYERWFDKFSASERDAIGRVVNALREIAEGER